MQAMQRLEGLLRKAMQSYAMIDAGDSVCSCVSGGKDSVALTLALWRLSKYYELPYTVKALTLDPCFGGIETDYTPVQRLFEKFDIPHTILRTNIGRIVFEERKEKNPCALCANMRRGALHTAAKQMGCNKVALGHHLDDAVETFYMNLFGEGRLGSFSPKTWLSRKEVSVIRPLVLAEESEVLRAVTAAQLPIVKNKCPVDGETARAAAKNFVTQRSRTDPAFRQKTLGALQKSGLDGWAPTASACHRANRHPSPEEDT